MNMKMYIDCSADAKKRLSKIFEVSTMTVWNALSYKYRTSELAKKIRHAALTQFGGRKMATLPVEETIHDNNGFMIQHFENGAILCLDKSSGRAVVENKYGDLVKEVDIQTFTELESLQKLAASR
jgi:hypothetical protein